MSKIFTHLQECGAQRVVVMKRFSASVRRVDGERNEYLSDMIGTPTTLTYELGKPTYGVHGPIFTYGTNHGSHMLRSVVSFGVAYFACGTSDFMALEPGNPADVVRGFWDEIAEPTGKLRVVSTGRRKMKTVPTFQYHGADYELLAVPDSTILSLSYIPVLIMRDTSRDSAYQAVARYLCGWKDAYLDSHVNASTAKSARTLLDFAQGKSEDLFLYDGNRE